jgi:hypothetical protein
MKSFTFAIGMMTLLSAALNAAAGEANSSAAASSNGWGPGTAAATAEYDGGGIGFARTKTKSGNVNFGQGISFGFDEEGLSLSSSYAVAPRWGPAAASTFNLAVGLDGSVSHSVGRTVASGDRSRGVEAGGFARPGHRGRSATAGATVSGRTGPRGNVVSVTHSRSNKPTLVRRTHHKRVRWRR